MCDEAEDFNISGEVFSMKEIKESLAIAESLARTAMMTSPAAKRRLAARKLEMGLDSEMEYVPPKQVLLYLVRMGSFSSRPRILNGDTADDEAITNFQTTTRRELFWKCRVEIYRFNRPHLMRRVMRDTLARPSREEPFLRVFQWNVLSQALGVSTDNFINVPPRTFNWEERRVYMLEELIQYSPDIICLEEVDHFKYLEAGLGSIGYVGKFFPKPDSPCLYVEGNNGPDGVALFYRSDKFEFLSWHTRILEVWRIFSNQVALAAILREKSSNIEICVAVTHLKAKTGALLEALRDHQGKDLLNWLEFLARGRPVILCGDFNAEPNEMVYTRIVSHRLRLKSGYFVDGREPPYTTWKIREDGEVSHTIDYIFHSSRFAVTRLLGLPNIDMIKPERFPSLHYPSDHLSMVVDLKLRKRSWFY